MAKTADIASSGVPDNEAAIVVGWYKALAERARAEILNPGGGTEKSQAYNQARASSRVAQLRTLARQIDGKAADWIGRRIPQVYKQGRVLADQQAVDAGVRPPGGPLGGDFNLIDSKSLHTLAKDTMNDLRRASGGVVDTAERVLRKTADNGLTTANINTIVAGGLVEGRSDPAIQQLRAELVKVHKGNLVTITNRNGDPMQFDAEEYAEMVVRTKTREAMVVSRLERFSELDIDLVSITGRLSNNFCSAFLNQVFSVSGKHAKYPALSSLPGGGPPFHPNCSKSIRPWIEELATDAQAKAAEPDNDVAKLLGTKPGKAQRLYQDLQLRAKTKGRIEKVVKLDEAALRAADDERSGKGGGDRLSRMEELRRQTKADIASGKIPAYSPAPAGQEADLVTVLKGNSERGEAIPPRPKSRK